MQSEALPDQPCQTVTDYAVADLFAYRDPDPDTRPVRAADIHHQLTVGAGASGPVDLLKFLILFDAWESLHNKSNSPDCYSSHPQCKLHSASLHVAYGLRPIKMHG